MESSILTRENIEEKWRLCSTNSSRLLEFLPRVPHLLRTQRQLQFEADINKLFMYTRLVLLSQYYGDGAEEIIEMAGKTSLSEQQRQVQENIHHLVENFCSLMDGILLPDVSKNESGSQTASPPPPRQSVVPETKPLKLAEDRRRWS
ncbi:BnaCnng26660D [Brassica napus]|uniref:BnaCnng26660D protein n=1 Tax=Brassica napus TaxID=3708 RepID=A0A078IYR9_BRANA|nr:BnaCnng26660D [Brassica napus]